MDTALRKTAQSGKNRGFILIELIIVLVIIVLLLAIIIPLVTHYIDDAKESAELSEARAVKVAMQSIINEDYVDDDLEGFLIFVDHDNYSLSDEGKNEVEKLLGMDVGQVDNIYIDDKHTLRELSYITVNGSKINYKDDVYTTEYIY